MWQHLTTWEMPEWETKLWFCWLYLTYIFSLQDLTTPGFLSNFTFLLQIHGHLVIHISDVSEVSQSSFLLPSNYSSLEKAKIYVYQEFIWEHYTLEFIINLQRCVVHWETLTKSIHEYDDFFVFFKKNLMNNHILLLVLKRNKHS